MTSSILRSQETPHMCHGHWIYHRIHANRWWVVGVGGSEVRIIVFVQVTLPRHHLTWIGFDPMI